MHDAVTDVARRVEQFNWRPRTNRTLSVLAALAIGATVGCGEVDDGALQAEYETVGQALNYGYSFEEGLTPDFDVDWTIIDVATGPNDDTYVLGKFGAGKIDFGGNELENDVDSGDDAFLVKFDDENKLIWQHSWGSSDIWNLTSHSPTELAVAPNGDVLVADFFNYCSYYGGQCTTNTLVRQFDPSGSSPVEVWNTSPIVPGQPDSVSAVTSIAVSDSGDLVAVGHYDDDYNFSFAGQSMDPLGTGAENRIFVLKWGAYDSASKTRTELWGTSFGGEGTQVPEDVAIDSSGNIAVIGSYDSFFEDAEAFSKQSLIPMTGTST